MSMDRAALDVRAREFFDNLWAEGDPWSFETDEFERQKYARQLEMLGGRRYRRALEIGCGAGVFTMQLARLADATTGIDVSEQAIARARRRDPAATGADFIVANVMEFDPVAGGPWDVIVMSETIYYLGWLYPFFDVAWLAHQLCAATAPGGILLMANTCGGLNDYLLQPWSILTYRDLFVNVGYRVGHEERFRGVKNGAELEALLSLFHKPAHSRPQEGA